MADADAFARLMVREFGGTNFDEALERGRPRSTRAGIAVTVLLCALVWGAVALLIVALLT
jgi:hypothetical protein